MFKKSNRLDKKSFDYYFKIGERHQFPHLTIITTPNKRTKVSVVVGKKVAKSAVRRNALRRRVYAVLRELDKEVGSLGVLIVILKPGFNTLTRQDANQYVNQKIAEVVKSA